MGTELNAQIEKSIRIESPLQQSTKGDVSEEESKSTVYVFYKAKYFQAFHYCYKLAKDCRRRIEKIIKSSDVEDVMHEDLYIRIGIVGKLIDADYKLISEGRAKKELAEDGQHWTASPLLCFQKIYHHQRH